MVIKEFGGDCMNYTSEIFERLNLQHIREFLMGGAECIDISNKSYEDRIEVSHNKTIKPIENKFSDKDEGEAVLDDIYSHIAMVEAAYMEIGIQCGAALAIKLLGGIKLE